MLFNSIEIHMWATTKFFRYLFLNVFNTFCSLKKGYNNAVHGILSMECASSGILHG